MNQQRGYRTESEREAVAATKANLLCTNNRLLEQVVDEQNVILAKKKVYGNKGAPGIDGRSVEDLQGFLENKWPSIKSPKGFISPPRFFGLKYSNLKAA